MEYTREGRHLVVRFGYNREVIEALKAATPGWRRRWDPERSAWFIDIRCWPLVERVFQGFALMQGVFTPAGDALRPAPAAGIG